MNYTSMYSGKELTPLNHAEYYKHMMSRENGLRMDNGKLPSCAEIINDDLNNRITYWVDL